MNYAKKLRKIVNKNRKADAGKMVDIFWQSIERTGFWRRVSLCYKIMVYPRKKI